jgi:ubiquinone/menaquinone biosynthesis C-methylase UbiE
MNKKSYKKMSKPSLVNKELSEKYPHDYFDDRIKNALKMVSFKKDAKYLDIGCSNGKVATWIAKKIKTSDIHGIDIANIEDARKNKIKAVFLDLNEDKKFPYKDNYFDIITCFDTLEHIYNTDHCIREIKRVLKNDGYAIIIVPRTDSLLNIILLILGYQMMSGSCSLERNYGNFSDNRISAHMAHFTKKDLIKMFEYHGFEIENYTEASTIGAWFGDQETLGKKVSPIKALALKIFMLLPFKKEASIIKVRKKPPSL